MKSFKGKIHSMLDFAVCEIDGKQVKIVPNLEIKVDSITGKEMEVNVLLLSSEGKIEIGKPYLKEKLTLKNVGDVKNKKVRVAKFHAKANFRKVTGSRPRKTKLIYGA